MYLLTKLSEPGWEKEFKDKLDAQQELWKHICEQCECEEGLTEISSIDEMLSSACGCEFMFEDKLQEEAISFVALFYDVSEETVKRLYMDEVAAYISLENRIKS